MLRNLSIVIVFLFLSALGSRSCKPEEVIPASFPAEKVFAIHIDGKGTLWAGSDAGLLSLNGSEWTSHQIEGLPDGEISDLVDFQESGVMELWIASSMGASIASYNGQTIQSAILFQQDEGKLLDNNIMSLVIDSLKACWYATPLGLSVFADSIWLSEDDFGDLALFPVNALGATSSGWIFAATSGLGVGRFQLDEGIDGISGASYYEKNWSGLPTDSVLSVFVEEDNSQWFGTTRGLAYHDRWETKKGWTLYDMGDGIIDNRIKCIAMSPDGKVWVGTPKGASVFDGSQWTNYNQEDGLGNEDINDLAIDENGKVWFATSMGISSYDGDTWMVYSPVSIE